VAKGRQEGDSAMGTVTIPLTRGQVAYIDEDDLPRVSLYKWYANWDPKKQGYYATATSDEIGKAGWRKKLIMHRLVTNAPCDKMVDHINGNGLDNRKDNLRIVTARENAINRKVRCDSDVGVTGVTLDKASGKYKAYISISGKQKTIGRYATREEAVSARKAFEEVHYGEYVRKTAPIPEEFVDVGFRDKLALMEQDRNGAVICKIPLTHGAFAVISPQDCELVESRRWYLSLQGYAAARGLLMHRVIMNPAKGMVVDHINGDKLDNRRENLRICSYGENLRNTPMRVNNKIGLKGVIRCGTSYAAQICTNYERTSLGTFPTPEEAHEAYCKASKELHGEFGRTQ
jgi:hypothetical protein